MILKVDESIVRRLKGEGERPALAHGERRPPRAYHTVQLGRRSGAPDVPTPNKLFHSPPERGKAIVDLETKGNISVWDMS